MSLFKSALNWFAGDQAAKVQSKQARANATQIWDQFQQTRGDLAPYRDAGASSLARYRDAMGLSGEDASKTAWEGYTKSPFLDGMVRDTVDAVDHSRAARGRLFSGGTATEIGDRTGRLFLNDGNSWLERLRGLAESGRGAAEATGQFGANAANARAGMNTDAAGYSAQRRVLPALAFNQFMDDVKSGAGMFTGGAFGR